MLNWPRVYRGRSWGRGGRYAGGDLTNSEKGANMVQGVVVSSVIYIQLSQLKIPVLWTQKKSLMAGCLFQARLLTDISNYITLGTQEPQQSTIFSVDN